MPPCTSAVARMFLTKEAAKKSSRNQEMHHADAIVKIRFAVTPRWLVFERRCAEKRDAPLEPVKPGGPGASPTTLKCTSTRMACTVRVRMYSVITATILRRFTYSRRWFLCCTRWFLCCTRWFKIEITGDGLYNKSVLRWVLGGFYYRGKKGNESHKRRDECTGAYFRL